MLSSRSEGNTKIGEKCWGLQLRHCQFDLFENYRISSSLFLVCRCLTSRCMREIANITQIIRRVTQYMYICKFITHEFFQRLQYCRKYVQCMFVRNYFFAKGCRLIIYQRIVVRYHERTCK